MRCNFKGCVNKIAPSGVVGSGVRGGSTAHARVGLGAVIGVGRVAKVCSGHTFVDLVSAFPSFVRGSLFGGAANCPLDIIGYTLLFVLRVNWLYQT